MTDVLLFLSYTAAGWVRITLGLLLVWLLLSSRRPGAASLGLALAGAAALALLPLFFSLPAFYGVALETVWLVLCASRLQGAPPRMGLFVGIFYEIALSLGQFLVAAWLGVLFRDTAFLHTASPQGQAAFWLLHALLLILAGFLWRNPDQAGKVAFRGITGVAVVGLLAVVTLSEQTVLPLAADTLDMWTMLALILTLAILLFHLNRQYQMEKELAALKAQQAELLERDYTALSRTYALHAKLFHDLHNHLGALRQLLTRQKWTEAMDYLDQLQAPIQNMTDTVWTGDDAADYLINRKAAEAQAAGIRYQANVEFPRHTNLQSADLCAILGNLLDNALEAAGQVPQPDQRFVQLTIRRIHQMLVIKVENRFATRPIEAEGVLQTTKEAGGLHGWGLKSAQAAAAKYDGMVQTSFTGQVFRAVVTLSYQGVSTER